jgi:NAD(P)-dependent dehydrogenase (short-subunit alcohol dehydrogenase family)
MFKNKNILITGAGTRLGTAIATGLGIQGANIIIHYNTSVDSAKELEHNLKTIGCNTMLYQCDFSNLESISRMFTEIEANMKHIDILINNAAIFETGSLDTVSITDFKRSLDINLIAPMLCIQYASKIMPEGSMVVNISDTLGVIPGVRFAQHSISKSALITMGNLAARTYAPKIRVNTIVGGLIIQSVKDHHWDAMIKKVPLKTHGSPEDIINAIKFLYESTYTTGTTINIDGGLTC